MDCPNCGKPVPAQAPYCPSCGTAHPVPQPRLSKLALAAFLLSFVVGAWRLVDENRHPTLGSLAMGVLLFDLVVSAVLVPRRLVLSGKWLAPVGLLVLLMFSILTPAINWGDPKQDQRHCEANLTVLWQGFDWYRRDHADQFPPADSWCDALVPVYLDDQQTFLCPERGHEVRSSYAINSRVAAKLWDWAPQTVLLFEIEGGWNVSGGREQMISKPRHPGGFMFLLADGEVRLVPEKDLDEVEW